MQFFSETPQGKRQAEDIYMDWLEDVADVTEDENGSLIVTPRLNDDEGEAEERS
jgi:hypothetical protein